MRRTAPVALVSVTDEVFPGVLDATGFDKLAWSYRRAGGFALAAVGLDGGLLRAASTLPARVHNST